MFLPLLPVALFLAPALNTPQAVLEAERIGCLAYQSNDPAAIDRFLTPDYTLTDSHGTVTTRQDDLDDARLHRIHYTVFQNRNMKVRLYPGAAIVTGQTDVQGNTADGKSFHVLVQFTDTLVLLHDRWRLAAGHVSRLPLPPA